VVNWALERTRGRFQTQVITLTTLATLTTMGLAAYVAWNWTHQVIDEAQPAVFLHLTGPSPQ
jgi:hypothetical protein